MSVTLRFLGSAAAEAIPGIFCDCEVCRQARKLGGKDIRMRTSYMIDQSLVVDMGPDTIRQMQRFDCDAGKIRHIMLTHMHNDHFVSWEFNRRPAERRTAELCVYGTEKCGKQFVQQAFHGREADMLKRGFRFVVLCNYARTRIATNISVTAIPATHNMSVPGTAMLYIIEKRKKRVFIGNDSGTLCPEAEKFLSSYPDRINAAIVDCTFGTRTMGTGHQGGEKCLRTFELFKYTENAAKVVNHFSHNCGSNHAGLEEYFNPKGVMVGYDGMKLEL